MPPIDHELNLTMQAILTLLGLFVVFPCTFYLANFGAGWPAIIAIHLELTSTPVIAVATVVSIGFAVVLVRAAASFLPQGAAGDAEGRLQPVSAMAGDAEQM